MDENKPKRSSLRGRGRQIMGGGANREPERDAPDEQPYFEDDEALLAWLNADDAQQFMPDEDTVILTQEEQKQSLDEIFREPDPEFDDLFGELVEEDEEDHIDTVVDVPAPQVVAAQAEDSGDNDIMLPSFDQILDSEEARHDLPDFPDDDDFGQIADPLPPPPATLPEADDDPLMPELDALAEDIEPAFQEPLAEAMPEPLPPLPAESEPPAAVERAALLDSLVEQEDARDGIIEAGFDTVPTPRPTRRSVPPPPQPEAEDAPDFEEAIPQAEVFAESIDLREAQLDRGALAGIVPDEPETLSQEQLPPRMGMTPDSEAEVVPASPELVPNYESFLDDEDETVEVMRPKPMPDDATQVLPKLDVVDDDDVQEIELAGDPLDIDFEQDDALDTLRFEDEPPPVPEFVPEEPSPEVYDDIPDEALDLTGLEFDEPTAAEIGGGGDVSRSSILSSLVSETGPIEPFGEVRARRPARELFEQGEGVSDNDLLSLFIDEARLRELFEQIEALQEEIVESVRGERGQSDIYQAELLVASNMLTRSRENYDEARAIVYRVRADLNRERRIAEDIAQYRPRITFLYGFYVIALIVLAVLGNVFIGLTQDLGVEWLGQGYYPALFGAAGALFTSYRIFNRYTNAERNFDPLHLNWYFMNPVLGLFAGFIVYVVMWAALESSLQTTSSDVVGVSPVTWLAAFLAGYNQNSIVSWASRTAQDTFAPGDGPGPRQ